MPDDLARTDSPLADSMRRDSPPHERDRGMVQRVPAGPNVLQPPHDTGNDPGAATELGWVVETVVSPFHCLYQDALHFHTQSRLAQSEGEAGALARAALLLYVSTAEALVRQAAVELGRPELRACWPIQAARSPWRRPGGSCPRSSPRRACPPARSCPSPLPGPSSPSC